MTYPFISDEKQIYSALITDELRQWAANHYRTRTFFREDKIPVRSGLLYFVSSGFVRLESTIQSIQSEPTDELVDTVIAFVGADQPIDIFETEYISFQAIAQTDRTEIFWVYWTDLEQWSDLKVAVLENLQYQYQRQLIVRSILGQKRTIDQLRLYIEFLVTLYGEAQTGGRRIPFLLTHDHLASVLGTTRVTISRLISQLKEEEKICIFNEQYIGIPMS
ncbi:MAG: Crp/Fnr family transcriptional regulator [Limnothrix sp. RL_2_0]|nr:Crp/Fnr family transcriptional regulator [Limnothrix sp. RL_2_0]